MSAPALGHTSEIPTQPVAGGARLGDPEGTTCHPAGTGAIAVPGAFTPRRRGPRPRLEGELLAEAIRRRGGESIRVLAAAFGVSKSTMARSIAGVSPTVKRSTDPRRRVQGLVRRGRLPHPDTFPCCDCRVRRAAGAAPHEYDIVASNEGGLRLAPVCRSCNRRRARRRRVGLPILESGRRLLINVGQRGAALPGGQQPGTRDVMVPRGNIAGAPA